jgi:hypothetical protein
VLWLRGYEGESEIFNLKLLNEEMHKEHSASQPDTYTTMQSLFACVRLHIMKCKNYLCCVDF